MYFVMPRSIPVSKLLQILHTPGKSRCTVDHIDLRDDIENIDDTDHIDHTAYIDHVDHIDHRNRIYVVMACCV